jgi:hypothetical protein
MAMECTAREKWYWVIGSGGGKTTSKLHPAGATTKFENSVMAGQLSAKAQLEATADHNKTQLENFFIVIFLG